ncbi:hypothetical protein VN12_17030 [Pirellula sp. SH-Sr6A]|nr:hypothetical protein VN12_17030 [Pirellula sp. SH-Sr6A]
MIPLDFQPILAAATTRTALIFKLEQKLLNLPEWARKACNLGDEALILSLFQSNRNALFAWGNIRRRTRADLDVLMTTLAQDRAF